VTVTVGHGGVVCRAMIRPVRHAVDVTVAATSLALILWLLAMVDRLDVVFQVTLVAMAALYLLVYLIPGPMARVMSMPFAFRFDQNRGRRAFDMQAVTYASYHTRLLAHLTHLGFATDAVAWTVLAFLALGWWGIALLVVVKIAQMLSYGSRRLAILLAGSWLVVGLLAWATLQFLDDAGHMAMLAVIASGLWRVVGHATEPIPPGVSGSHRFVPLEDMGLSPTLGASSAVGFVAETASGVPFRLFDVWVFDLASRLFGFTDDRLPSRAEIDSQRAAIYEGGWGAAPATAHLLTIGDPPVRTATRPTSLPPYPNGWYAIAFSDELVPGQIHATTFCGDEVVAFRTVTGTPVVMDAHCPHLGAHLGIEGRVVGEAIQCPFHGFCFDAAGACVSTGYGTEPPRGLAARTRIVHETDGVILTWHHIADTPPTFSIPDLGTDGWTQLRHRTYRLRDHPQETTENGVDLGHFAFVHGYESVMMLDPVRTEGATLRTRYSAARPMPWLSTFALPVRFEFAPEIHGLGYSLVRVAIPDMGLNARLQVLATPVDGTHIDLRLGLRLARIGNKGAVHPLARLLPRRLLERIIARFILDGFSSDASADFPIWENKAHVARPRLARGDGPIGVYRSWAEQFYQQTPVTHPAYPPATGSRAESITVDLRVGETAGTT
jgi:nitrite reductase/ring-hydroxylating ferredoxin subunit